jgi:hypothetical protein
VREATEARNDRKYPHKYGVVCAIHRQAAQQHDRVAKRASVISLETTHGKIAHYESKRKTCSRRFARHRVQHGFFENICQK